MDLGVEILVKLPFFEKLWKNLNLQKPTQSLSGFEIELPSIIFLI